MKKPPDPFLVFFAMVPAMALSIACLALWRAFRELGATEWAQALLWACGFNAGCAVRTAVAVFEQTEQD